MTNDFLKWIPFLEMTNDFLKWVPFLTFCAFLLMSFLTMWMLFNMGKLREEFGKKMILLEKDLIIKIEAMEKNLPTKEQFKYLKREFRMMLYNIATQLKLSTKGFEVDDDKD